MHELCTLCKRELSFTVLVLSLRLGVETHMVTMCPGCLCAAGLWCETHQHPKALFGDSGSLHDIQSVCPDCVEAEMGWLSNRAIKEYFDLLLEGLNEKSQQNALIRCFGESIPRVSPKMRYEFVFAHYYEARLRGARPLAEAEDEFLQYCLEHKANCSSSRAVH